MTTVNEAGFTGIGVDVLPGRPSGTGTKGRESSGASTR